MFDLTIEQSFLIVDLRFFLEILMYKFKTIFYNTRVLSFETLIYE